MVKTHKDSKIVRLHSDSEVAKQHMSLERDSNWVILQVEPFNGEKTNLLLEVVSKADYEKIYEMTEIEIEIKKIRKEVLKIFVGLLGGK